MRYKFLGIGTNKWQKDYQIVSENKRQAVIRFSNGFTVTLNKVEHGKEIYLKPLNPPTEYPEGKGISCKNPEDGTLSEADSLDRRAAWRTLQEIRDREEGHW